MIRTMWKDIIGHGSEVEELRSSIRNGRVAHAYLFAGPEGLGKTRTAKEFFKAMNCLNTPGDPCDSCRSCLKADNESHPDYRSLGPRNGQIVIEDVRDMIAETALKPFDARRRVIVIEPAERLNKASSNALLKTLEEPPEGSILILVSHKPSLLLPTIVSRCQVVRFSPLEASGKNTAEIDPFILRLTSGTLGGIPAGEVEYLIEARSAILQMLEGGDPVQLANKYFPEREPPPHALPVFLILVESCMRDFLVLANGGGMLINEELREILRGRVRYREVDELGQCLDGIRRGTFENVNQRYAVSELLMRLKQAVG